MKRILSLLLVLCLFLPVLSLAELDEDEYSSADYVEEVDLDESEDEEESDTISEETINARPLSDEELEELKSALESSDYVAKELDESKDLCINENIPESNVINILLLGVDTRNAELIEKDIKLADVQMILSVDPDKGTVKLASILRDTLVTNPYTGNQYPINYSIQSYNSKKVFHDNPERSIATVNYNFELNIKYYVMINFRGVLSIVDFLGGVDLELTKGEADNINYYLKKNAKKIAKTYDNAEARKNRVELEVRDGVQHLDGLQSLMYARLRQDKTKKGYDLGDDWQRTFRTRNLLDKLLQKVLKGNTDYISLASFAIDYVDCNLNVMDMINLVGPLLNSGILDRLGSSDSIIDQFRIPADIDGEKTWSYVQEGEWKGKIFMSKRNGKFQKNVEALHEFLFGEYYPAD